MISKDMSLVLSKIPRSPQTTTLIELQSADIMNISLLSDLLQEAIDCRYVVVKNHTPYSDVTNVKVYLAESGQIALEEFEQAEQSRKMADESMRIAKESLKVAKAAKWAAIASAVAAGAALLSQIPEIVETLRGFFPPA